jgi:hypothetical protein
MPVGQDEKIHVPDIVAHTLQSKLRRGVHLHMKPVHHDVN